MIPFFKKLFTDETAFVRFMRALLALVAGLLPLVAGLPPWVTPVGTAIALFVGSGDKNNDPQHPVPSDNIKG